VNNLAGISENRKACNYRFTQAYYIRIECGCHLANGNGSACTRTSRPHTTTKHTLLGGPFDSSFVSSSSCTRDHIVLLCGLAARKGEKNLPSEYIAFSFLSRSTWNQLEFVSDREQMC